jgi:hypothetical protein
MLNVMAGPEWLQHAPCTSFAGEASPTDNGEREPPHHWR